MRWRVDKTNTKYPVMRKSTFLIVCFLLASIGWVEAQSTIASGKVVSADDGQPIIGASILVKGMKSGVVTDINGLFSISMPADSKTLVVSYVGMKKLVIEGKQNMLVRMESSISELDEVMVVAYGSAKKTSFTGSASQVSGGTLQKIQSSSITKSLEGISSGLQTFSSSGTPGSDASLLIRGLGSISASQEPLIVVDGVPYEGSLNSISSQDIESITILKDAAANSMYGARGSNGVLIVTSKSGAVGDTKVLFDAKFGFNTRGVANYNVITKTDDYYEMMYESIVNSLVESGEYSPMSARAYVSENLIGEYLKYNKYANVADNQLINPITGRINPAANRYKWSDNWLEDPFTSGARQEYNLSISGGNEKTNGYASMSYLADDGYLKQSGFDRITLRAKVDHVVSDYLETGLNISYSNTVRQEFGLAESNYSNIFMFSQQIAPIYPIYLYDANGNKILDDKGKAQYDFGTLYTRPYGQEQNPYATLLEGINKYTTDNMSSRGYVTVNFTKDIRLNANISYDVFNENDTEFDTPIGGDALSVKGRGYKTLTRSGVMNANQLLYWTPTYGDHSFNLLLGHESKKDDYSYLYGEMTKFSDPNNPDFANASTVEKLTSYTSQYALEGYFSRLEYNFLNTYYLSSSYRRDGSSIFAPDQRWGDFYAIGGSWRINQESFMTDYSFIDDLKLKASYGTQGNDNIGFYKVYADRYEVDSEGGFTKVFRASNVTWEKSDNFNIGFELGLMGCLNIDADFFIKETKDMIYKRPLPPSEGSPSYILVNDIDMKNTGFEIEVSADIINQKNLKWNVTFNGTTYKNELTKLPSDKDPKGYQVGNYFRKIGGSLYDWYTYEYAGVDPDNGLPLYNQYIPRSSKPDSVVTVNQTSSATLRETGKSPIPDFYGGLTTSLSSHGFDLSISTAFQLGGYVWDTFYRNLMNPGLSGENMHQDMFKRWTPANKNTDVPRLSYLDQDANDSSDRWLTSASYFSLRNVTLGYTLPTTVARKANMERVRVYVVGDNIWLKSARKGLDPRQNFDGSTDYVYSALSTYSLGVNIVF